MDLIDKVHILQTIPQRVSIYNNKDQFSVQIAMAMMSLKVPSHKMNAIHDAFRGALHIDLTRTWTFLNLFRISHGVLCVCLWGGGAGGQVGGTVHSCLSLQGTNTPSNDDVIAFGYMKVMCSLVFVQLTWGDPALCSIP